MRKARPSEPGAADIHAATRVRGCEARSSTHAAEVHAAATEVTTSSEVPTTAEAAAMASEPATAGEGR
jgi:hypothetical protein